MEEGLFQPAANRLQGHGAGLCLSRQHTAPLSEEHTPLESMRNRWPGPLLLHTPPASACTQPLGSARNLLFILQTGKSHRGRGEGSYSFQGVKGADAIIAQFPAPTLEGRTIQPGRMPAAWAINSSSPPLPLVPASPCRNLWAVPQALWASSKRVQMGFFSLHCEKKPIVSRSRQQVPDKWGWRTLGLVASHKESFSSAGRGTSQGQPFG